MSSKLKVSDMLARAFAAEGVDHLFTLMGDANMYWSTAMAELPGMRYIDTWNAAVNDHMIAINERMGFRAVDAWPNWQMEI